MIIKNKKNHKLLKTFALALLFLSLFNLGLLKTNYSPASASINDVNGLIVGTTYYGGHYDSSRNKWVIDNKYQCDKIKAGAFTASSLDAVADNVCDDDSGLGYMNDTPLHNRVSFAELSSDANNPDWSALGGLPAGTKLEINYKGRCLVAEKLDVGIGGGPVNGVHRSLDLWWQTARSLGFYNGWDLMTIKKVASSTPLTPVGSTTTCTTTASSLSLSDTPDSLVTNSQATNPRNEQSTEEAVISEPQTAEAKTAQAKKTDSSTLSLSTVNGNTKAVLGAEAVKLNLKENILSKSLTYLILPALLFFLFLEAVLEVTKKISLRKKLLTIFPNLKSVNLLKILNKS